MLTADHTKVLFWKDEKVLPLKIIDKYFEVDKESIYYDCFCYDGRFPFDDPRKFGMWYSNEDGDSWINIPKENIPPKFLATLLLMGFS